MIMFIKLAWRNIFRNKRRTILSALAIGIGLAALILADALIIGMEKNMIKTATDTLLGQGLIHFEGFKQTQEIEKTIKNPEAVLEKLGNESEIKCYAPRVISYAMISSPANVSSIMLYGIDPNMERDVSKIDDTIIKGSYLHDTNERKVMIGKKLAETLEVGMGDRVVITLAQAHSGDLSQEMYRIGGIFNINVREIDKSIAFVPIERAQKMMGLVGEFHEIVFHFTDLSLSRNKNLPFWKNYSQDGNIAESWVDIMSDLASMLELSQFSIYITAFILFGVVSLGIMNTLFMSLYERMFEFGVLRAVGTRPLKMALLIIFEAGGIAVVSIVIGLIIGFCVSWILADVGIDYTGLEFGGITFQEKLYPVITTMQYIRYPVWLFLFTIVIGIYPAIYAARLTPANALRKSF